MPEPPVDATLYTPCSATPVLHPRLGILNFHLYYLNFHLYEIIPSGLRLLYMLLREQQSILFLGPGIVKSIASLRSSGPRESSRGSIDIGIAR